MVYKKKKYLDPELDVVLFLNEDIITLSLGGTLCDDDENTETLD